MYDISVIVPTYNVENYIEQALLSVINQTFKGTIELIVIDDCSTDSTVNIVESIMEKYYQFSIKLIKQPKNMRQGTARNLGIRESNGQYIIFLDGDDLLDSQMFKKMFEKAQENAYDFVLCDWVYYKEGELVYVNSEKFMRNESLEGDQCESLLEAMSFFTVNKLYKKEFLTKNNIYFGEMYIYEDVEFYVDVAQKANNIGIVHNPFYKVRVNISSTTKTNTASDEHVKSFIKAIDATIKKFNPRNKISTYFLYRYLVTKALNYTKVRAPKKYRKSTMEEIFSILNKDKDYFVPAGLSPFYNLLFGMRFVQDGKHKQILFLHDLYSNNRLKKLFLVTYKLGIQLKNNKVFAFIKNKLYQKKMARKNEKMSNRPIKNNVILFLGFDYRYVGNSKYFYDYLINHYKEDFEIYFATYDSKIPSGMRIAPRSEKFFNIMSQAKFVIGESWLPLDFPKKEGQQWIQLWHGTPFKKMLFDSHEKHIMMKNTHHKKQKHSDIMRWDLLLADSNVAVKKFVSSFAINEEKIINFGYPRVQWLKENEKNENLKLQIKKQLNIPLEKKVVLYAPTWRDYNYKQSKLDLEYVLNLEKLQQVLGNDYVVMNKNHNMANAIKNSAQVISPPDVIEVQNLILISDIVISDYSSIIFDAIAINKVFYLYITDYEKYEDARGVYTEMYADLNPFIVHDFESLVQRITNSIQVDEQYAFVKKEYSNTQLMNSNELIYRKLKEKINS